MKTGETRLQKSSKENQRIVVQHVKMEEGSFRENIMKKQTKIPQINKNNKSKPENLLKKEYVETLEKLKKDIQEEQN